MQDTLFVYMKSPQGTFNVSNSQFRNLTLGPFSVIMLENVDSLLQSSNS